MIDSNKIDVLLNEHEIKPIEIGKSGACVYSVDNTMILKHVKRDKNEVNRKHFLYQNRFVHGDFHCNNILVNENDEILVCDWQNTGVGDFIGDLSFFISRLLPDGYVQREDELIQLYVEYANEIGLKITEDDIKVSMCLANINTTFLYWHNYLHDSPLERVSLIYDKMILDMKWLLHK